jgi:hypothetical protein
MMMNKKHKKALNGLTLNQKKKGTGYMSRLKVKGKKTQLGKKATQLQKKIRKTR